ncbi:MAG: hypothetical protein M3Y79_06775, partial [Pseudomonadota bacterium]|nr:hypothetical protein [Pseudomonadota bacterium]
MTEEDISTWRANCLNTYNRNVGAYDKAVLTVASAALGLTIVFSKDIAPLRSAVAVWALIAAGLLLLAAICINVIGFLYLLQGDRTGRLLAEKSMRGIGSRELVSKDIRMTAEHFDSWGHRFNVLQGGALLLGLALLAMYVGTNVIVEAQMPEKPT